MAKKAARRAQLESHRRNCACVTCKLRRDIYDRSQDSWRADRERRKAAGGGWDVDQLNTFEARGYAHGALVHKNGADFDKMTGGHVHVTEDGEERIGLALSEQFGMYLDRVSLHRGLNLLQKVFPREHYALWQHFAMEQTYLDIGQQLDPPVSDKTARIYAQFGLGYLRGYLDGSGFGDDLPVGPTVEHI